MRNYIWCTIGFFISSIISTHAVAELIDPEKHILNNGYDSVKLASDRKTNFYFRTEPEGMPRIANLEAHIAKLPKNEEILRVCDLMRGSVKARLIEQQGIALDVAVTNYGYSGQTLACVLKYMHGNNVGTQLFYSKKGVGGMYTVIFVTKK